LYATRRNRMRCTCVDDTRTSSGMSLKAPVYPPFVYVLSLAYNSACLRKRSPRRAARSRIFNMSSRAARPDKQDEYAIAGVMMERRRRVPLSFFYHLHFGEIGGGCPIYRRYSCLRYHGSRARAGIIKNCSILKRWSLVLLILIFSASSSSSSLSAYRLVRVI